MAEGSWIYQICGHCGGNGYLESVTQSPGQEPEEETQECPNCGGLGIYLWGYMTKDNYGLPAGIPEAE